MCTYPLISSNVETYAVYMPHEEYTLHDTTKYTLAQYHYMLQEVTDKKLAHKQKIRPAISIGAEKKAIHQ